MITSKDGIQLPRGIDESGAVAGDLDASTFKIINLGAPSGANDAARNGEVVHLAGAETLTGVKMFSVAFKLATYTVATLPAATVRQSAYVSDALKTGESTGNGTGTVAYADGTAWKRVADDTTVSA